MTYENAVRYFGSPTALAAAMGISTASVAEWKAANCIPEVRQYQIELATNGDLRADKPALRTKTAA